MNKSEVEMLLNKHKQYLEEQFHVDKIGIFGSYARNEQNENSDIDILVDFSKPVGFEFFDLKDYLENIFQKKVDLVTVKALKPIMKENVLSEVQFQ